MCGGYRDDRNATVARRPHKRGSSPRRDANGLRRLPLQTRLVVCLMGKAKQPRLDWGNQSIFRVCFCRRAANSTIRLVSRTGENDGPNVILWRLRRGGRARFKAHAWRACRLGRVSGVRIPPSPPRSMLPLPPIVVHRPHRRFMDRTKRSSQFRRGFQPFAGGLLQNRLRFFRGMGRAQPGYHEFFDAGIAVAFQIVGGNGLA
jgi:hypothetical protein